MKLTNDWQTAIIKDIHSSSNIFNNEELNKHLKEHDISSLNLIGAKIKTIITNIDGTKGDNMYYTCDLLMDSKIFKDITWISLR